MHQNYKQRAYLWSDKPNFTKVKMGGGVKLKKILIDTLCICIIYLMKKILSSINKTQITEESNTVYYKLFML